MGVNEMKIVVLDAGTLGVDTDMSPLDEAGTVTVYQGTAPEQVAERISDADMIVNNKLKLSRENLQGAQRLKLICLTSTGYDMVDCIYCRERGIGVCNVPGYSTQSVAQLTAAMALNLATHLGEYRDYVHSGAYTRSGVANSLVPVWHELAGKTWGVLGGGGIGQRVAEIARAMGCRVLMCRRKRDARFEAVDLQTLCRESDILSVHVPLNDETRGMIGAEQIGLMKRDAIFINVARGAVADEEALAAAIEEGRLGALGVDVYSAEPFGAEHPYHRILDRANVCLTPHMAWGAAETRNRCIAEVAENMRAFLRGERRNRVEACAGE